MTTHTSDIDTLIEGSGDELGKLGRLLKILVDEFPLFKHDGEDSAIAWITNSENRKTLTTRQCLILQYVEILADKTLIYPSGSPNIQAMLQLKNTYGFKVVKGEGDSHGWLTGVIITDKGRICYG